MQIGDGAIVARCGERYEALTWPESGEYVNTTRFLTDSDVDQHIQYALLAYPVRNIALLTDGLQGLALHFASHTAHAPFFTPFFDALRAQPDEEWQHLSHAIASSLDSPMVNARTDDDKTLIVATYVPTRLLPARGC
jgi:hypothetical protein